MHTDTGVNDDHKHSRLNMIPYTLSHCWHWHAMARIRSPSYRADTWPLSIPLPLLAHEVLVSVSGGTAGVVTLIRGGHFDLASALALSRQGTSGHPLPHVL